jgi:hypothetical protein
MDHSKRAAEERATARPLLPVDRAAEAGVAGREREAAPRRASPAYERDPARLAHRPCRIDAEDDAQGLDHDRIMPPPCRDPRWPSAHSRS